jgi:hypothetical protein
MSRWKKRNWMMGGVEFRNKFVRKVLLVGKDCSQVRTARRYGRNA